MQFRLRTLLIVLAIGPPLIWLGRGRYLAWKAEQARREALARQQALPVPRRLITRNIEVSGNAEAQIIERVITTPIQPGSSGPIPTYRFREP